MNDRCVLIMSGGLDSAVLLYLLLSEGKFVLPLTFYYGQRHQIEMRYAETLARRNRLQTKFISLESSLRFAKSSQTDTEINVPEGHYADENMKKTVVGNRNMIMLATAASYAIAQDVRDIYYAAHAGDHAIYPDCRVEFIVAMREALKLCDWNPVLLHAPFSTKTKAEIVALGDKLNVPFEDTWSCYKGGNSLNDRQCGRCATCVERQEAFHVADIQDPTRYVDSEYWRTVVA